jgi:hypothetical protein
MALSMKSTVLCDVTPCSLVSTYRKLGIMYCLHLQVRKVSQVCRKQESILLDGVQWRAFVNTVTIFRVPRELNQI